MILSKEIFEKVEAYGIGLMLTDSKVEFKIKDIDIDIYDPWEPHPNCFSMTIENKNESFKLAQNVEDGELILVVRDNDKRRWKLFNRIYNEFKDTIRRESGASVSFVENSNGTFTFDGYFLRHERYVSEIVDNYIKKRWRDCKR